MLIKKIIIAAAFILLLFSQTVFAMPAFLPEQGVYVFETRSGDVVYSQNETQQFAPASTTKLMTSLVLLDYVQDLNEEVVVGAEVHDYGSSDSRAGLWQGQQLSYLQLLNAMLIPSGNDAAGTIAINVGKKILNNPEADKQTAMEAFVSKMNERAHNMGLKNTNFMNPSGFTTDNHYTTPKDMSKIAQEAFSKEVIRNVTATLNYPLPAVNGGTFEIYNTDMNIYPATAYYTTLIQNGKTGTNLDGDKTFVFHSAQNGAEIIGVIFKYPNAGIFSQSKQVAEDLFSNYQLNRLGEMNNYSASAQLDNVHFYNSGTLDFGTNDAIYLYTKNEDKDNYILNIRWNNNVIRETDQSLKLVNNINEGDKVGALVISNSTSILKTVPIYAKDHLATKDWTDNYYIDAGIVIFIILVISLPIWFIITKQKFKFKKLESTDKQKE